LGTVENEGRSSAIRLELRELYRLAIPVAIAQAGVALMGVVDTAVVGRLGADPLAAVGLANGLFFSVAVVGIGVMLGLDPLISQAFGAGEQRRARDLLWQGVWLSLAVALAVSLVLSGVPLLLKPAGIQAAVAADATGFLLMRLPGLAPMFLFIGLRSYLQAVGRVKALVVSTVLANVLNLLGDILLVYGGSSLPTWAGPLRAVPSLGAPGAGLSTTLCSFLQMGILAVAVGMFKGEAPHRRSPLAQDLRGATRLGLPIGLQMGAEVGVFALVALLAGRLNPQSLAAHTLAISLASFTFCAALGIGNAGSVRVAKAVGAGDLTAARRAGLVALASGAAFMFACACIFWIIPRGLANALSARQEVVAVAAPLIVVAAFFQISDGLQAVGAGILRGAGDTRYPFFANLVGHYLVGLPIGVLLGLVFKRGVVGLWWGLCAGLTFVAVGLYARFWDISSRPIARVESLRARDEVG
jgi:MATE family multidrug resistance protein